MKVVTTVHKAGFEQYGYKWIESIKNWPKAEFIMYAEGFEPEGVEFKRCEDLPRLVEFKAKHKGYIPPSWHFDIVRFSNKVFAAYDAFYDYDGVCVWLDADCETYKPISEEFIRSQLPEGAFMSLLKRVGMFTETGFWMMDGKHPEKQAFMDTWLQWFESGKFKMLNNWHDCTTLDMTIRMFEKDGRVENHNLSGNYVKDRHPMAKIELGKYIDHVKGSRKELGFSPENKYRKAA